MARPVILGVDVGQTNTDAVVLSKSDVISSAKSSTTRDIISGVKRAITLALNRTDSSKGDISISRIHIGTTHFLDAVVQRRNLVKVAVIRLCGTASLCLPPYSDFPGDLKKIVCGGVYTVNGGFEFDGEKEISKINESQLQEVAEKLKRSGVKHAVVSGIFSPVNDIHELKAAEILRYQMPGLSLTLSSSIGTLGLLERENAAVLNESLKPLASQTLKGFRQLLDELGLTCPFHLTQNDGTLLSAEQALELPVHTIASGLTNSMRGATFLSGRTHAIVVDIGGTTTNVGIIVKGYPREAGIQAKVGGVRTNFRMPDIVSISLGGGSVVQTSEGNGCKIGHVSVGDRLEHEAMVFGGSTLTLTDIAVASGLASGIGDKSRVDHLPQDLLKEAQNTMQSMLEKAIDQIRVSAEEVPVLLIGGGSMLLDHSVKLSGISEIIKPHSFAIANAVGAALSKVAGYGYMAVGSGETTREQALQGATQAATDDAVAAGVDPDTVETVDVTDVPMTKRIKVKVVGDLKVRDEVEAVLWKSKPADEGEREQEVVEHVTNSTEGCMTTQEALTEIEPHIDSDTGEWHLSSWDVECISIGAGILGCGGGGSPENGRLQAHRVLEGGSAIRVIHPNRLMNKMEQGDRVAPLGFMGAPAICNERLYSEQESMNSLQAMRDLYNQGVYDEDEGVLSAKDGNTVHTKDQIAYIDDLQATAPAAEVNSTYKKNIVALLGIEIGGSNCFAPLLLGARSGLPIVDGDLMGRAFPELQMCVTLINGVKSYPATLADHSGRRAAVLKVKSAKALEDHFRDVVCQMGCLAALMTRPLIREELNCGVVKYSLSRAWRLGKAVLCARLRDLSPIQAIIDHEGAHLIASGKIGAIERRTVGGFTRGELTLQGLGDFAQRTFKIDLQNENLVAMEIQANDKPKVLASTPDLLSLVKSDSGQPIATEEMRYGLQVSLIAIPAPPELTTPQALKVVGPHAFGYPPDDVIYNPVGKYVQHKPVPPV